MRVPVTLLFLVWANFATSSPEQPTESSPPIWRTNLRLGGTGNDETTTTELKDGETVTIHESHSIPDYKSINQPLTSIPTPTHQKIRVETINPPTPTLEGEINSVAIKDWHSHTTPMTSQQVTDDVITLANSVSAPWRDVMLAGLPPAIAYDWRFLIDIAAKFKTAAKSKTENPDRTSLKYLLHRVSNNPLQSKSSLDTLKINHQLKNKMTENVDEPLLWAWKRVSPLE